jgi:hypothetical protein
MLRHHLLPGLLAILLLAPAAAADDTAAILQRQTQELLDAIVPGDRGPWTRYLDDEIVYSAEDGSRKSKTQLVDEIRPFPKDVGGTIRITGFRTIVRPPMAVATYVLEEEERYFGQTIHARYMSTDTWIRKGSEWRLVAVQVTALRDDPPAVTLPASTLDQYVGTYALTPEVSYSIRRDGDALVGQRTGRKPETLKAELADCFFVPGDPRIRKIFRRDADGRITGFVERRETWDILWRRVP